MTLVVFGVTAAYDACVAHAQPPRGNHDAARVVVRTVDTDTIHGQVAAFTCKDGLLLSSPGIADRRIPTEDVVRITALGAGNSPRSLRPAAPGEVQLTLVGGDKLVGTVVGMDDIGDAMRIRTADFGDIALPLDAVLTIHVKRHSASSPVLNAPTTRNRGRTHDDIVTLTNGDEIRGYVTAIDAESVTIETAAGETVVPYTVLAAVRLATDGPTPLTGLFVTVTLVSSGRLTATTLDWSADVVRATLRHGPSITIEPERIARIDVVGGRWEWLSHHEPISFEHTPMLSLGWEYGRDEAVTGGPIRVDGRRYEHGVGVHSRSTLTYDLKGRYRVFVTMFGLDDTAGPLADVVATILVDGKTRYTKSGVRAGKLFGPVRIDVAGAKRIELIVDYGVNGDLQDRFDWVEAALIR